jgi:hypothetical protein
MFVVLFIRYGMSANAGYFIRLRHRVWITGHTHCNLYFSHPCTDALMQGAFATSLHGVNPALTPQINIAFIPLTLNSLFVTIHVNV